MKFELRTLCMLAQVLLLTSICSAQPNVWRMNGPEGGRIDSLDHDPADPDIVYAGGEGGTLFKSSDDGATWTGLIDGLRTAGVRDLLVTASAVYAATSLDVLKSTDGGQAWTNQGVSSSWALAASADETVIYAGKLNGDVCRYEEGDWTCKPAGIQQVILALAVDPNDSDVVFAAGRSGISRTGDGGDSWEIVGGAIEELGNVSDLAFAPGNPSTLYAAAVRGTYSTQNAGQDWTEIFESGGECVVVDPTAPQTLYLCQDNRLRRSVDGGSTWESLSTPFDPLSLSIRPDDPDSFLAGSFGKGVQKSGDGGASWTERNSGLNSTDASQVVVAPDSALFAVTRSFVSRSLDGGASWTNLPFVTDSLAAHPTDPNILITGSFGVFKSTDKGDTFGPTGLQGLSVEEVLFHPTNPETLYAATSSGVQRSLDGGDTWAPINDGITDVFLNRLLISGADPQRLLATTQIVGEVFRTSNGGGQWETLSETFPEGFITALSLDPLNPSIIYAGTTNGLFKSTDFGDTWKPLESARGFPRAVLADPNTPNLLYFAAFGQPQVSVDGGSTWTLFREGLTTNDHQSLARDPNLPGRLYLGTGSGVATIDLEDFKLYFAQFGQSGSDLFSQLMLFNLDSTREAKVQVLTKDNDGQLLEVELAGKDTGGQLSLTIPAGGLRVLKTSPDADLAVGSVIVCSDRPLGGVILFGGSFGVAGVGSSPAINPGFTAPMQVDGAATTNTGVAVVNLGSGEADYALRLLNSEGELQSQASESLPPLGHLSKFVNEFEWNPPVDFSQFEGQLAGDSDQLIAATVIQTRGDEFATMPVAALPDQTLAAAAFSRLAGAVQTLHFAQYGNGADAGFELFSELLALNLDDQAQASATLTLTDDEGALLPAVLNGMATTGEVDFMIPPSGLRRFRSDAMGQLVAGAAQIQSQDSLAGVVLFGGSLGLAGVGSSTPTSTGFRAPLETDTAAGTNTGIAVLNTTDLDTVLDLTVRDLDGTQLDTAVLMLGPGAHKALFLNEFAWQMDPDFSNFLGTLTAIPRSGSVTATVIQTRPGQFATLPVENLADSPVTE